MTLTKIPVHLLAIRESKSFDRVMQIPRELDSPKFVRISKTEAMEQSPAKLVALLREIHTLSCHRAINAKRLHGLSLIGGDSQPGLDTSQRVVRCSTL